MYLPAYSIVAVVLFLLILISISTYRNLNREEKRAMAFVHRQGLTLLNAIEAGARTGMMMHMWHKDTVAHLIGEIAKNEDVAYIYMFDAKGRIVQHSRTDQVGKTTTWDWTAFERNWVYSRMNQTADQTRVYEIAKFFSPMPSPIPMGHMMRGTAGNSAQPHPGDVIVLGLKMAAFDAAGKSDLRHAMMMGGIVLALGTAAFFFVFVIQNYYLVDRTLRQTQDYARQIVASMASGLVSIDLKGNIISYNEAASDLLGLEEAGGRGIDLKSILDFQAAGIQDVMDQCRTITDREIRWLKAHNEIIPLSVTVSPIRNQDGVCTGAVIILRDLRKIKQLEESVRRSEKLAAVGQLAAGLAHEIRNPLSSIRGFAQFLRHALTDSPKEQEYAEIMVKEIDRINRVVTDLLSFANPKSAESKPTNVGELINHVIRLVDADIRGKNVTLEHLVAPQPADIDIDAYQMTQALLNLLLNALKFVEPGGKIEIRAYFDAKDERYVFEVTDDGTGIPDDNMAKIFDPFFTTRETGTGLGLAIVHQIIENHRGDIDVESPPPGKDKGCRFVLRIPMDIEMVMEKKTKEQETL